MNNFLDTLKSQFEEDKNTTLVSSCSTLDIFFNSNLKVNMDVYKQGSNDIISIEFTGI